MGNATPIHKTRHLIPLQVAFEMAFGQSFCCCYPSTLLNANPTSLPTYPLPWRVLPWSLCRAPHLVLNKCIANAPYHHGNAPLHPESVARKNLVTPKLTWEDEQEVRCVRYWHTFNSSSKAYWHIDYKTNELFQKINSRSYGLHHLQKCLQDVLVTGPKNNPWKWVGFQVCQTPFLIHTQKYKHPNNTL